jgi:hypothetical protein
VWTQDADFKGLKDVKYIRKKKWRIGDLRDNPLIIPSLW